MNINRKHFVEFLAHKLNSRFLMTVHAETPEDEDEEDDNDDPHAGGKKKTGTQTINYEDLVKAARKEEKTKLYTRLKTAEENEKKTLLGMNNLMIENGNLKVEIEKVKEKLKTAGKDGDDTQTVKDLKQQVTDLTKELSDLKKSGGVDEKTIREQVKAELEAEYAVKLYREQQLAKNRKLILEVFEDLIEGKTNEEIDESIKKAIEKSKAAKKQMGIEDGDEEDEDDDLEDSDEEDEDYTPPKPKVKNTPEKNTKKRPPVGNPPSGNKKTGYSAEDIKKMTTAEYAELRKSLGLK